MRINDHRELPPVRPSWKGGGGATDRPAGGPVRPERRRGRAA